MEYIIIPKEVYNLAPKAKLQALGMDNPRMKVVIYNFTPT